MTEPVTTIQATGKGPKLMQLFGVVFICLSVFACAFSQGDTGSTAASLGLCIIGVVLWIAGRFTAWWRHG